MSVDINGFVFESFGVRVGLRANRPSILDRMRDRLPPFSQLVTSEDVSNIFTILAIDDACLCDLYSGESILAGAISLDHALDELESWLHSTIAEESPALFVHAGVVAWQDRAIVIPGRSMSGKSTLVAALLKAGATYYSDEYAVFDEAGLVHPYPKPLSLRDTAPLSGRSKATQECVRNRPLPVALLIATRFKADASWRPKNLTPGQAALRLFENTVDARQRGESAIRTFARMLTSCLAIGGPRPSADRIAQSILDLSTRNCVSSEGTSETEPEVTAT
jgi:hypothetical protein